MNTNNIMPESYEIDLAELVRLFWRNKLIILILSILCATFGHLYTLKLDKSKEFKSEIITRTPLKSHFLVYDPFLNPKDYSKEFNSKISSIDFLEKFVNQNNNIPKFKNYLQNNNISAKLYFAKKFTKILSDNDQPIENKFSLTYHESLDGNTFLNDYVKFVKNETILTIKKEAVFLIRSQIRKNEYDLEIAKKMELKNSLLKEMSKRDVNSFLFYAEPEAPYYKGSIILNYEILNYKKMLKQIETENFDFNPILDRAITTSSFSKSYKVYPLTGFVIGFLISVIIIYFRQIINKK
jgi:LPS O-antigen subunit length determinant protein (WzzB/FepE family)